jgi:hypothetical protein
MHILRNAILIALAFDANEDEIAAAHDLIDRIAGGTVDPAILVHGTHVPGAGTTTGGSGNAIPPNNAIDTPPAAAGDVQLDGAGLPWDERIHSSNKKLNDKGLWWAKRGVTPQQKGKVEAELRATLTANGAAAATPVTPVAAPAPAAGLPPMPGANLPPLPGTATVDPAYAALVKLIADNTQSATNPGGRLTDEWIGQVLTHYGVEGGSLQNLAHAPALVKTVSDYITSALAAG